MGKSKPIATRRPDHYIDENGVVVSRSEVEGSRLQLVEPVGTKGRPQLKVTQPEVVRPKVTRPKVARPKVARPKVTRAPSTHSTVLVQCPQCGCDVSEKRLADHMSVKCPKRGASVQPQPIRDSDHFLNEDGVIVTRNETSQSSNVSSGLSIEHVQDPWPESSSQQHLDSNPFLKDDFYRDFSSHLLRARAIHQLGKSEGSPQYPTLLVECPLCKRQMSLHKLEKHMRLKCSNKNAPVQRPSQEQNKKAPSHQQAPKTPTPGSSSQAEALIQSDREPRFADKYVGQMRREGDGKFGSLPLYDDYGDEADAD